MTPAPLRGFPPLKSTALSWRPPRFSFFRSLGRYVPPTLRAFASIPGLRHEEIQPQALRQEFRGELALHAVAGGVQWRRERAETALAGRDRDDAPADPAFSRQADIVKPVARGLVESGRYHHCQCVVTDRGIDDALLGDRIDAAVSQRRAHDGEVPGA